MSSHRWRIIAALVLLWATIPCVVSAQGVATWLETEHDFGTFNEQERTVKCHLRMVNTGDSALIISRVQPTCGCTASYFDRSPLKPGDTTAVELTYSAVARPGQFQKDVFVYTTGSVRKTVLTIKGNVIASPQTVSELYPVAVGDMHLETGIVPVGEIVRGRTKMIYLTAYNAANGPMHLDAHTAASHIIAHAVPDTIAPGQRGSLTIFYDSQLAPLWGLNTDTVTVRATGIGHTQALAGENKVEVMAVVIDDLEQAGKATPDESPHILAETDKVNFETVTTTKTLSFKIKNTGRQKLELRRVSCPERGISVKCNKTSLKRGKTATVSVTVTPAECSQKLINTNLTILTNDPENHNLQIRVVGLVSD